MAPSSSPDRTGTVVANRYKILSQLGEGGIGAVYAAEDTVLRMPVALKLLHPEVSENSEIAARFEREADAMIALAHEHAVRVFNFGRTPEGELCMVMEKAEGETLRTIVRNHGAPATAVAVEILSQIASALARAHSLGIVHRDLKPENVMVAKKPDGRPFAKVLDFGMARIMCGGLTGQSVLTRKGQVFGTPEYMAPEQAMGQPVDARCDQYALGVMAYELLAGKRPFKAPSALDMLQMQIHTAPPPLAQAAPGAPPALVQTVEKMMAKRRADRFTTVQEAADAMQRAMPPIPSMRSSTPDAGSKRWWHKITGGG